VEKTPDAELDRVRLYLNFDMIASPNFKLASYDGDGSHYGKSGPPGSAHPQRLFDDYFRRLGWGNVSSSAFDGRSDYEPFISAGIPAGGTATGADEVMTEAEAVQFGGRAGELFDPNYHLRHDDVSNIHPVAFLANARAIAHAVASYARSMADLPPRDKVRHRRAIDAPVLISGGMCGGHHDHPDVYEPVKVEGDDSRGQL